MPKILPVLNWYWRIKEPSIAKQIDIKNLIVSERNFHLSLLVPYNIEHGQLSKVLKTKATWQAKQFCSRRTRFGIDFQSLDILIDMLTLFIRNDSKSFFFLCCKSVV